MCMYVCCKFEICTILNTCYHGADQTALSLISHTHGSRTLSLIDLILNRNNERSNEIYRWITTDSSISYFISSAYHHDGNDDDSSSNSGGGGGGGGAYGYCSSLSFISNGYVTYYSRRPGSIARYSCRSGYTLDGNAYRKCLSSGYWSGSEPKCKSKSDYKV